MKGFRAEQVCYLWLTMHSCKCLRAVQSLCTARMHPACASDLQAFFCATSAYRCSRQTTSSVLKRMPFITDRHQRLPLLWWAFLPACEAEA